MYPNTTRKKSLSISADDILRLCREGELSRLRRHLEDEDQYQQKVRWTFGKNEYPLLFEAVDHSQTLVVQYLLCKEVDVNFKVAHRNNNTPLHTAVSRGNEEIVILLLEKGASTTARNESGETPLHKAIRGRKRNMEFILRSYDVVSKARELSASGAFKEAGQAALDGFKAELDILGRNFQQDCANSALLYFAKSDMHTLSAKCVLAGADCFEQAILFAEKTNSTKTLSQLLLCQAAKEGDYNRVAELLGDPPAPSHLWYMSKVQRHLSTYFHSDTFLRKPALMIALREGHFFTAGTLLKHSRRVTEAGGFHLDWADLSLRHVHEIWMHTVSPWVEQFNLSNNKLTSLPNTFLSLLNIRVLDLSHNNLSGTLVIIDLMRLQSIEKLRLSDNKIRELPNSIVWPPSLSYLDISRNKLTSLPACMATANIACLICQGNSFSQLPVSLFGMASLKIVDLKDNLVNGFSDVESLMSRFHSESVTLISPEGEMYKPKHCDVIPENIIVNRPIKQQSTIMASLRKLNVMRRPPFKSPDTRKVCLTLIGEKSLHVSVAHKLLQTGHVLERPREQQHAHYALMHFTWTFSPNLLRGRKIAFNTMVLKSCSQYARYVSCFLPEMHLIGLIHDASSSAKDTEANLVIPLTQLVRHIKRFALIVFVQDPKVDDSDPDMMLRDKKDTLTKLLEKHHLIEHLHENDSYRSNDIEGISLSDLSNMQTGLYNVANNLLLADQKTHPHLHAEVEHVLFEFRDISGSSPQQMDRRALEAQLKKNLGGDFILHDSMLGYLKEIGAVLFFDVPLNDLSLCLFVNPGWIIVLIMHICDVITQHHLPVISEDTLKEKLAPKCENAFTASLSFLKQIFQILIHFDLLVPVQTAYYLLPFNLPNVPVAPSRPLSHGGFCYQMQFKRENICPTFWHRIVAQVLRKLQLATCLAIENKGLTSDSFQFERMGAQFCLAKIKERTDFDGFSISTNSSGESFDVLASICSLIHVYVYQNFYFTRQVNELCKSLQVCIPCPTCLKLEIDSPKHFVFDSVLLCLHEDEQIHCSQHEQELNLDNIRPDVYFHDMPRHLRTLDFHPKSILRRSNTLGGSTDHTYEYMGQMVTIRGYHFNSTTPLLPFYTLSNEVRLLHSLKHDNVVQLVGFNADALFLIMEQLPQLSLAAFLESPSHQLDRLTVFSFSRQIIAAVDHLHSRGVVYRSLQPANILITSFDYMDSKNLILSDFREAAFLTPLGCRGQVNRAEYQAPEMSLYEGMEWYNELIDVYAFGCVLRDMLTAVTVPSMGMGTECSAVRTPHGRFRYATFSESLLSISSNLSMHSASDHSPVVLTGPPGYKLYTDLVQNCWSTVLRDRPPASLLHFQISRLEFHLFQNASQPPDPILIHFFVQVDLPDSTTQVWAIGDDAHLNSLEHELSIIYVYDQDLSRLVFTIDVLNQIVAATFSTLLRVVWTAEKDERSRNRYLTPVDSSVINAYSPVSFNRVYQFSIAEDVVSINTSQHNLFLGLSNCCVLLYSLSGAQLSLFPFSQPSRRVSINPNGGKVRCIEVLDDRTVWVACGALLSIFREQNSSLVPSKVISIEEVGELYVSHLICDPVNRVMWAADSRGRVHLYDLHTLDKCYMFDDIREINTESQSQRPEAKLLEIQSMCLSRDLLWLGITSGHILLINRYKIVSWVRAHKSKVKCLFHLSPVRGEQARTRDSVVSTGTGCMVDSKLYQEMNYFLKWEALGKDRLELLETKCNRTSFIDELHSFM